MPGNRARVSAESQSLLPSTQVLGVTREGLSREVAFGLEPAGQLGATLEAGHKWRYELERLSRWMLLAA